MTDSVRPSRWLWLAAYAVLATVHFAPAAEPPAEPTAAPSAENIEFFEMQIRPLLVKHCYECHGDIEKFQGGLRLTSRASILAGGETGPAAIPGKPVDSLLIDAVRHQGFAMPPRGKLPDEDVEKLVRWVEMGVPWPENSAAPAVETGGNEFQISDAQRSHWAFQPVKPVTAPALGDEDWPAGPIDRFVLSGLKARNLRPNGAADKSVLLRRITFDLIGLPPTPAELQAFVSDPSPDAVAKVIDRLLESPHYGERWGRHWLDVVRYADTAGDNCDFPVPQAYLYRNYVIDAFQNDKPYNEFVTEQIAGDILALQGPVDQYAERVTATGYLAISRRFGFDEAYYHHLTIADTIDAIGRSLLGLSIGCARCHDHKFDPVSAKDYYALYGILSSTRYPFPGAEHAKRPRNFVPLLPPAQAEPLAAAHQAELARLEAEVKRIDEQQKQLTEQIAALPGAAAADAPAAEAPAKDAPAGDNQAATLAAQLAESKKALEAAVVARDASGARHPYPLAYAVAEGTPADAKIQKHGEKTRLGDEVPRGWLEILGGERLPADAGSGRRQLADWIVQPTNPLTSRVIVNRIWHYHFGRGLVATPNDFGMRGRQPTHPGLLDYLAARLVDSGWSLKALHREILLSRTYQMSSDLQPTAMAADPENQWLWRFSPLRLDAESIRDAILAISGQLDTTRGSAHPFPPEQTWAYSQHSPFKAVYDTRQRSVYLMTQRFQRHPFLGLFDGADPSVTTGERITTVTPSQALFLMNDPFVHAQAGALASRLMEAHSDLAGRLQLLYESAYARQPSAEETQAAGAFLAEYESRLAASGAPAEGRALTAWTGLARVVLGSNEFLHVQ